MQKLFSVSVRALLPATALLIASCGGGNADSPQAGTSTPATSATNRAPTITGDAPGHAVVGKLYEYAPTITDPDGDKLTLSAQNLPSWAHLDTTTGRISGTPTGKDMGEYDAITVSAADATHRTTSAPFNIIVANVVATLTWSKPVSKVDGETLDDLAGYRIVYGRDPSDLDQSVFVSDPNQTSYQFEILAPGNWYFAVIGVSASGLEGPPTAPTRKTI